MPTHRPTVIDPRELVFWVLALAIVLAIGEPIVPVLLVALILAIPAAVLSALYLTRIYSRGPRRSWVFRMLIQSSWRKVGAGAYVGFLTATYLAGVVIPRSVTAPISTVVVLALLTPPIIYAVTVWRARRRKALRSLTDD